MRQDSAWFTEYVKTSAKDGEPLPYHPKMGLTEAEYHEMLQLAKENRMVPASHAQVEFRRVTATRFELDGGNELPELTGVVIDLDADKVTTPLGVAEVRGVVEASPDQKATGPWEGIHWSSTQLDESRMTGFMVSFNLGRLTESGRGILYYSARRLTSGSVDRVTRVLTYPLERQ